MVRSYADVKLHRFIKYDRFLNPGLESNIGRR